jgi:hypothetical protein
MGLLNLTLGNNWTGALGHVQVYVSLSNTTFGAATQQAQVTAARTALSGQYTGQRITTLARYAGIPASQLTNVDNGIALMSAASLAGQSPYAEMKRAETTEQGRLRADGRGQIVFDDRLARYNV